MALPRKSQHQFKWAFIFLLCLVLPYRSVGRLINNNNNNVQEMQWMKLVLGSRPPSCIHKCMNCSPCMAVLVIPPHKKIHYSKQKASSELTPQDEENYYLLAWRCKCKNRLFPP